MQSKHDAIALYCKATYPTVIVAVIVVIDVRTEPVPGHDKNPRGFKVFKFASVALHML